VLYLRYMVTEFVLRQPIAFSRTGYMMSTGSDQWICVGFVSLGLHEKALRTPFISVCIQGGYAPTYVLLLRNNTYSKRISFDDKDDKRMGNAQVLPNS
jgi:hypothetical protein